MALCPPEGVKLDGGGTYLPSKIQGKLYEIWKEFWYEWIPLATKGEPFAVVMNGDIVDGSHHNATTQITHNLQDQSNIAFTLLEPIVQLCEGRFYMTRGTDAHVGQSGENEEELAQRLEAIPNETGQHARFELFLKLDDRLLHFAHHIGTTGSMAYETSAVMKELSEMYADSARWGNQPPDVISRAHRHRHIEVRVPTKNGYGIAYTTPAWQLKTNYAYKIPGGRVSQPQIGGSLIRKGDREMFTEHFVRDIKRPEPVEV